jgi:acetyl-CoA carboxylase biotin carboxyl carrier protein
MEFDEITRILEIVRQHELSEFELEREGFRIRIKKGNYTPMPAAVAEQVQASAPPGAAYAAPVAPAPVAEPVAAPPMAPSDETEFAIVKSPIVGTFFRASEPGAAPFVEVGSTVKKGQVLCIIEAMKLMNEIDSEYDGEIVKIYVDNAQPVQYGERLFAIKAPSDV